jgi:hypothetical protein
MDQMEIARRQMYTAECIIEAHDTEAKFHQVKTGHSFKVTRNGRLRTGVKTGARSWRNLDSGDELGMDPHTTVSTHHTSIS